MSQPSSGLPRPVWKWLLGMDLPISVSNPRRDFQSGENIGYILNYYYSRNPDQVAAGYIEMKFMNRGTSYKSVESNWQLIKRFLSREENSNIPIPNEEIEGTIHAKPGCVEILLIRLFQIFTGTSIKTLKNEYNIDFT